MKKYETKSLGKRIKMLRLEAGESQKQLAGKLCISRSCVGNYETGTRQPDSTTLLRLAEHFHVTSDYLLNRCENRTLDLTPREAKEALALSQRLQSRGNRLDITEFSEDEQLAMLSFYDYIKNKEARKAHPA
ncbi:MAG: helix-turn-helix transcriptional regulator [Clostridia bacterium]|nr:helix-turn-helix transcriptional regulator [Clostridia bacterium]